MTKVITCIECPRGCSISLDIENCKAVNIRGAKCPKGVIYAAREAENPVRILTTVVASDGLVLKFVPVRTNKPIPKKDIPRAMEEVKKIRLSKPVGVNDTVIDNFLGLGVKLIATREAAGL